MHLSQDFASTAVFDKEDVLPDLDMHHRACSMFNGLELALRCCFSNNILRQRGRWRCWRTVLLPYFRQMMLQMSRLRASWCRLGDKCEFSPYRVVSLALEYFL